MDQKHIGFIGAGNMATALISGLLDGGYPSESIWVSDIDQNKLNRLTQQFGLNAHLDNDEIVRNSEVLVLAVKPQVAQTVLTHIDPGSWRPNQIIISIAAGILESDIERWVGQKIALIRAMPNTPALIRSGATGLHANSEVQAEQKDIAESILRSVGLVVWLESESELDAVTAISGSGPAYFFLLMEAMEECARSLGLDSHTARVLIEQTAFGATKIALEVDQSPAELRQQVTSPGGTTQKALQTFEEGGFRTLVSKALSAAHSRSIEMSRELGGK